MDIIAVVVVYDEHVGIAAGGWLNKSTGEITDDLAGGRGEVGVEKIGAFGGGGLLVGGRKSLASSRSRRSVALSVAEVGEETATTLKTKGEGGVGDGEIRGAPMAGRLLDWRLARC